MIRSSDELAVNILKRIQESVSCAICHNIITNPMRNHCGHRFCYYCIVNALDPSEDICNCPKCNAAVNRNRLVQDIIFGKIGNKAGQLIDSIRGSDLSDKPAKNPSPIGKRRLPTERHEDIDLDKSIEETEAEAREMARDIDTNKGTKRPLDTINEPVETVKRSFAMPKTSTPTASGKERELSPFPVSFLNKFTLQAEKRPSDKQASPSPKRLREPLHRKLSFEGDERREVLMSDSSDSEDRRIRSSVTYSRFDRVKQSIRKHNFTQTEIVALPDTDKRNQSQQTDGTNSSDLYSTLSNLFNCLCTQHGIQGSINIEGIGRFEINLSKPDERHGSQVDQSHIAIMVEKLIQTDPEPVEPKPILKDSGINTSALSIREKEIQTNFSIEKQDKASSPLMEVEIGDTQVLEIDLDEPEPEPEQTINVNGTSKLHHEKLGDLEISHEVTSISQIVKEFSEDPLVSQEDDDNGTRYDHIKASTRISAFDRVDETDVDSTEIITQAQPSTTKENNEESDIEDDMTRKTADEESNIVLESDDDDKFLMSCVFDELDDDDDESESARSLDINSIKSSGRRRRRLSSKNFTNETINDTGATTTNNDSDY